MSTLDQYKLFATPNYIRGFAKALDIGNALNGYNESNSFEYQNIDPTLANRMLKIK